MNEIKILIIASLLFYGHLYSSEKYSFIEYELPNNIVKKGGFELSYSEDGFLEADVKVLGDQHSYVFKSVRNIPPSGFNIFDLKDQRQVMGISLFTLSIDPSIDYKSFKQSSAVETLDRNHPFFLDQSWNFYVNFKGYEQITLSGKEFNAIHLYTHGERPTGPSHCMYGGIGVINIDSWYSKETGKLLKQVFVKRNCRPYDYKFLSKEILELQQFSGVLNEISPVDDLPIPPSGIASETYDSGNVESYDASEKKEPVGAQQKLKEKLKQNDITEKDYIDSLKQNCQLIGFSPNTDKFRQCVLELM